MFLNQVILTLVGIVNNITLKIETYLKPIVAGSKIFFRSVNLIFSDLLNHTNTMLTKLSAPFLGHFARFSKVLTKNLRAPSPHQN